MKCFTWTCDGKRKQNINKDAQVRSQYMIVKFDLRMFLQCNLPNPTHTQMFCIFGWPGVFDTVDYSAMEAANLQEIAYILRHRLYSMVPL